MFSWFKTTFFHFLEIAPLFFHFMRKCAIKAMEIKSTVNNQTFL